MGATKTLGAIIFKQGQEGQGRPADVFIRRRVVKCRRRGNPLQVREHRVHDLSRRDVRPCRPAPTAPVTNRQRVGYICNVWGEASGDRLCGGIFTDPNGGYPRRDHINLTSADIDLAVDAGPEDDTPDDPTDDVYGTNKVLLWSQYERNLGDESFGLVRRTRPAITSPARSAPACTPTPAATAASSAATSWSPPTPCRPTGRRRATATTATTSTSAGPSTAARPGPPRPRLGGVGVNFCPRVPDRSDSQDPDGSGNLPPDGLRRTCGTYDPALCPMASCRRCRSESR